MQRSEWESLELQGLEGGEKQIKNKIGIEEEYVVVDLGEVRRRPQEVVVEDKFVGGKQGRIVYDHERTLPPEPGIELRSPEDLHSSAVSK